MEGFQPAVSVVLPVYNTAEFLEECIASLINQTLRDIELIFVDDGSTDNSVDIIRRYQEQDSRIQLYMQKNQFAGAARNNGLGHATGKYIIFLDSDDFFELQMLEDMFREAERNQSQIVVAGFYYYDSVKKTVTAERLPKQIGNTTPQELGKNIFSVTNPAPWNKLYLREYVIDTGLKFQCIKNTNDTFFTRVSLVLADRISFLNQSYVFYRVNNGNSLQASFSQNSPCFGEAIRSIKEELVKRGCFSEDVGYAFYCEVANIIGYYSDKSRLIQNSKNTYYYSKNLLDDICGEHWEQLEQTGNTRIVNLATCKDYESYLFSENNRLRDENSVLLDENACLQKKLIDIQNSTIGTDSYTYKVGRLILYVPNKIKKLFSGLVGRICG